MALGINGLRSTSTESSEDEDVLNLADDEGWEDLEPDVEPLKFYCLSCDVVSDRLDSVLNHCKNVHSLDLVDVQKSLDLDFLGMVKLVNYLRSKVKTGNVAPNVTDKALFEDDLYLQPVLEDDALLFNLHDIIGEGFDHDSGELPVEVNKSDVKDSDGNAQRVAELEERLQQVQQDLDTRTHELENIRHGFGSAANGESEDGIDQLESETREMVTGSGGKKTALGNTDPSYFASYSGHEVHETMLKDSVRTDAYRDFIYENKHLFKDKTVLDVGCGTGILSMFCARAGASKVIAVDNSDIIDFARENVYRNGMAETISCLRGKIEEVVLPVKSVDFIVSEWMGYCLLYEAMLDSVLWARDRYLKTEGLMIPSHCVLRIAPISDTEYIEDHVDYWKDVYGFDMMSMHKDIYNDVMVRDVQKEAVRADSIPFLTLALKKITAQELTFEGKSFRFEIDADMEALDGFVIWFDTFFLTSHDGEVPSDLKAEDCERRDGRLIAFSTGPHSKRTHWQQGVLLIDQRKRQSNSLKKGQVIQGSVGYRKRKEDNRALDIDLQWNIEGDPGEEKQSWSMR